MATGMFQDKLGKHGRFLVETLKVSIRLREKLYQASLLTQHEFDLLRQPLFEGQRVKQLLELLLHHTDRDWPVFLRCLRDVGRKDVADYLSCHDDPGPPPRTAADCLEPYKEIILEGLVASGGLCQALQKHNLLDQKDLSTQSPTTTSNTAATTSATTADNADTLTSSLWSCFRKNKGNKGSGRPIGINDVIVDCLSRQSEAAWWTFIKVLIEQKQGPLVLAFYRRTKELSFRQVKIKMADIPGILYILHHSKHITKLRIEECFMDTKSSKLLAEFFKHDKYLKELCLSSSTPNPPGLTALLLGFGEQPQQNSLKLSRVCNDAELEAALLAGLALRSNIHSLSLAGNRFVDLAAVLEVISGKYLSHLDLSDTGISGDGVGLLSECIFTMALVDLRLAGNHLGDHKELEKLMKVLQRKPVQLLDLNNTDITGEGVSVLLDYLSDMNIPDLRLSNVGFADETNRLLRDAIQSRRLQKQSAGVNSALETKQRLMDTVGTSDYQLTHLDLKDTVDNETAVMLTSALSSNTSLQSLDLRGENLYDNLIFDIMANLRTNETLEVLWTTDYYGKTSTLIIVSGTGRRVLVRTIGALLLLQSWSAEDLRASSALRHNWVHTSDNKELALKVDSNFSTIYGDDYHEDPPDILIELISDVVTSRHKRHSLQLELLGWNELLPLLNSLISHWKALVGGQSGSPTSGKGTSSDHLRAEEGRKTWRIEVLGGQIGLEDLESWYTKLSSRPGWSIRALYDNYSQADGAEITDTSGRTLVLRLRETRLPCNQDEALLMEEQYPGLLCGPQCMGK